MIKATLQQVMEGYRALRRINEEVRLSPKAAWRMARLQGKLRGALEAHGAAQIKLILDAGGVPAGSGAKLPSPVRNGESDQDWARIQEDHKQSLEELDAKLQTLVKEVVEIDYDPIPLGLLNEDPVKDKPRQFSANDLQDAAAFLTEGVEADGKR